ncbi:HAD-IC family P-type ATPase [Altererythrobacter sp. ZODW24]|uniref:cation-translocating P-type ATPase n=1 Tax=Altererythrobacter sp. ZODW24 TaxID=2185142 RepID=UPI000DF803CC|nr:HAD-IC family P-type ATPase [Altererythrobacter sp. ZODW24]
MAGTPEGHSWHALTPAEALAKLASSPKGLSDNEARRRLEIHGPNRLPEARPISPIRTFLRQFANPLIYLLLVAGILSLAIGDRWDALFIFGVLTLNAVISGFQELKADASARALRMLVPQTARLRRAGTTIEIASSDIVPGDIVALESGMKVTADIRLLNAQGLRIDESLVTGESMPVAKDADCLLAEETDPPDRITMAHAGTAVVQGRGEGVVVGTGGATVLGGIGRTLQTAAESAVDTPMVRRMGVLGRQIAVGTMLMISLLAVMLAVQGESWRDIILLAIALAVSAIPEGLPVAVTVALSAAANRMAKRNVIVRALPAVEGLGACTLIASDKTGTLTLNKLTVESVVLPSGTGLDRHAWIDAGFNGQLKRLGCAAALCNEARLTESGSPVGDAVDIALLDLARETGCDPDELIERERLEVIHYEPVLKYAAVAVLIDNEEVFVVKGAPEVVLAMCRDAGPKQTALAEKMAANGYRVLALAQRISAGPDERLRNGLHDLELVGFVGITDPLRHGVIEAVSKCRNAGIDVRMITGDHPATALAIAQKLGMSVAAGGIITGAELAELDPEGAAYSEAVRAAKVFARTEPAQKLSIVLALERLGEIVAVTGDGVNDGPALQAADIGVAMGRGGTDVARGAADLVLADDNFATIVAGIEEGRVTFLNIRKIVLFMLATGLAEICMFLGALAFGLPMPLTPVQLLWLNVVTNGVQDVTLGFARGEGDELQQPPRRNLAALVDRDAIILMLPGAVVMTAISVWILSTTLADGASIDAARNAVVLTVVFFHFAYLISIRHLHRPFWRWNPPENLWMFVGMATALTLQIAGMYFPPMQALLGLSPVTSTVLLQCLVGGVLVLLVTETTKRIVHRVPSATLNSIVSPAA